MVEDEEFLNDKVLNLLTGGSFDGVWVVVL